MARDRIRRGLVLARLATLAVVGLGLLASAALAEVRVKDVARIQGVRDNELYGYGLIVGLAGTGDRSRNAIFTPQAIVNLLLRMGVTIPKERLEVRNVAAVMATVKLPPFVKPGAALDATVSSIGDATSLQGGTLLLTPLQGGDGKVYAVAQGAVSIGGFAFQAPGTQETVQKNHPTVGRVPQGAIVEREVPMDLRPGGVALSLLQPDFTTAHRLAQTINKTVGSDVARPADAGLVSVVVPTSYSGRLVEFIALIEVAPLITDGPAKVVINERTGTIIIGHQVRINTVAVSHGNLSLHVKSEFGVSQPPPFSRQGQTVVVPRTETTVTEDKANIVVLPEGVALSEVVRALNAIGATPRDLIAILQAIKRAGGLQADLEIM